MEKDILIEGIQTNNLKGINVSIRKNAINLIVGPSGSGKSSLAYDTVAQIGLHELSAMYSDGVNEPNYKVKSFSNMVVTVPIKQINTNNNVRSTIGTYFSLNPCLAKVFSSLLCVSYDYFVLNKSENVCQNCMGVGYIKKIDPNKIIDYDCTISDVPIRIWKRNKDFYKQILQQYCADMGISASSKFRQLSEIQKNSILYGCSEKKYKIKYRVTNHDSVRTTQYFGPMTEKPMLKSFSPSNEFFSELLCDKCNGEKYEAEHRNAKICGYSIGELLLLEFINIPKWVDDVREKYKCKDIEFSLVQIKSFAQKAIELNLGYLFINRNIPSLSGGELQRLRLIQVFSSQLSDLLIVLDEPLAGLSTREKDVVYQNVVALSKKHTLLIVDHHDLFINIASNIIALGPSGGKNGGELINHTKYLLKQNNTYRFDAEPPAKTHRVKLSTCVYGYKGVDVEIAEQRLNVISGVSGVGKSTLLREYFPQAFNNYLYINQKPLGGNIRSTVATDLDISNRIGQIFTKKYGLVKSFFSNMSSAEGACRTCKGTGTIIYGSESQSQVYLECKDCQGTGFDKKLTKYKINEKSIQDIWAMTLSEGIDFFKDEDNKVCNVLESASDLLLDHLKIGEKTADLSGGENIRMKLMKANIARKTVLGVDEPFKGLNSEEIYRVVLKLNELMKQGRTIIVVDHEESCYKYFSKHIVLSNEKEILKGK